MNSNKRQLTADGTNQIIDVLKNRFDKNLNRHENLVWSDVAIKLAANPKKLWSLNEMEATGGEPDVVGYDQSTQEFLFYDCSPETPKGRRSICYDQQALDARKEHKPKHSAMGMANEMGIEILSADEYHSLQNLGAFDTKTSSWLKTSSEMRKLGGAIFGDFRFNTVFIYHNGVESYYGSRGFRGKLSV